VQVDPMKLKLKPPGTYRLKLNCDDPLSIFAFKFNLRRYNEALEDDDFMEEEEEEAGAARACLPRHPPHCRPSFLELTGII